MSKQSDDRASAPKPPKHTLGTGEIRAVGIGGAILGLPVTGLILLIALLFGVSRQTMDFLLNYWWVPPLIGAFVLPPVLQIVIDRESARRHANQMERREEFAGASGFEYIPPDVSSPSYSPGVIRGTFNSRPFTLESGQDDLPSNKVQYTLIRMDVANSQGFYLSVKLTEDSVPAVLNKKPEVAIKYEHQTNTDALAEPFLSQGHIRSQRDELELYHLELSGDSLELMFVERTSSEDERLNAKLTLASQVADYLERMEAPP